MGHTLQRKEEAERRGAGVIGFDSGALRYSAQVDDEAADEEKGDVEPLACEC